MKKPKPKPKPKRINGKEELRAAVAKEAEDIPGALECVLEELGGDLTEASESSSILSALNNLTVSVKRWADAQRALCAYLDEHNVES